MRGLICLVLYTLFTSLQRSLLLKYESFLNYTKDRDDERSYTGSIRKTEVKKVTVYNPPILLYYVHPPDHDVHRVLSVLYPYYQYPDQ